MIETPEPDVSRAVLRAVLEAGAQFTPVTAVLARLYQTTHPSQFEQELAAWRHQITDAVNGYAERFQAMEISFQPRLRLGPAAQQMAVWFAKESTTAHRDGFGYDALRKVFSSLAKRELDDAVAELKQARLIEVSAAAGHPILEISPTTDLYLLMDPVAVGNSPQADAVELARAALVAETGRVRELAATLGWSPRRMNPALALLLPYLSMRSREINRDYLTTYFAVGADERVAFRRLIEVHDTTQLKP